MFITVSRTCLSNVSLKRVAVGSTRWCPHSYKLVYNPKNYRYNPLINPSYSPYKPTERYLWGTTLYEFPPFQKMTQQCPVKNSMARQVTPNDNDGKGLDIMGLCTFHGTIGIINSD